jgi:hypothetical protein
MNIANDLGEIGRVRLSNFLVKEGDGKWVSSPPKRVNGLAYPTYVSVQVEGGWAKRSLLLHIAPNLSPVNPLIDPASALTFLP